MPWRATFGRPAQKLPQLRPPTLTSPTTLVVTGTETRLDLFGAGKDWIIQLPATPIDHSLEIHGRDQARHIVIIGGAFDGPLGYDPVTMLNGTGADYAVYSTRGFTGATGGTFTVRTATPTTGPYAGLTTAPIAWNATPATIKTAMEVVLGTGSVKAVDGVSTPGGPWKFVPADDRLGRVIIDRTGLTGTTAATSSTNTYAIGGPGLTLKQWTGTLHMEGVFIGGAGCDEGMNVQNPWDEAIVQMLSCHVEPEIMPFHNDHHHTDALQSYLGPTEFRAERCDFIGHGSQAFMGQPRETSAPRTLDGLRDWWFKDCLFEARETIAHRTAPYGPGAPCYMEDDWPGNAQNQADWAWRMQNCYGARSLVDGTIVDGSDLQYFNHYPHPPEPGIVLRSRPATGIFADRTKGQCGLGYVSPGYGGAVVTSGTKRLQGETKLT